jgi:cytochrome P450
MLAGNARITAVDNDGKNFIADVAAADLWYFPAGIPQVAPFFVSEVFARTPKDVLSKNFGVPEDDRERRAAGTVRIADTRIFPSRPRSPQRSWRSRQSP